MNDTGTCGKCGKCDYDRSCRNPAHLGICTETGDVVNTRTEKHCDKCKECGKCDGACQE